MQGAPAGFKPARALPRDLGPHWLTCFEVACLDDVLDRLARLLQRPR
ncbi:hypothetical protein [Streptomyces echinatus]|uniref:Uncharacterized protein n=1 Tax=Streptomyces echinatus TaxID=67293 RepID=A0A7W9PX40_9ACTN|nr:hypothetical protein [Streptomyces echinatus]MBB5929331.1 hypothetical protein [Streptomyces echinatus]